MLLQRNPRNEEEEEGNPISVRVMAVPHQEHEVQEMSPIPAGAEQGKPPGSPRVPSQGGAGQVWGHKCMGLVTAKLWWVSEV